MEWWAGAGPTQLKTPSSRRELSGLPQKGNN